MNIPYGYKPVPAGEPTQKGDGKWDGERFRKVKREYPRVWPEEVVIRRQEVRQLEICPEEET